MLEMSKRQFILHAQLLRFLVSGGMAFFTNIFILYLFTGVFGFWYLTSSVVAFTGGFIVSFSMQKFWTFKNREIDEIKLQVGISLAVALMNLMFNTFLMYLFVGYFSFHYLFAQVCAAGIIAVESYFIYKHVIFISTKKVELNT